MVRLVVVGAQRRQPLVAHQHQEALLGEIGRRGGVETAGAVLDGIEPVGRQGRADRKGRARQRLRRQPLHRVAVNGVDPGALVSHWFSAAFRVAGEGFTVTYIKPSGLFKLQ